MKKIWIILTVFALTVALCGCGNGTDAKKSDGSVSVNSVNDVLAQQMNEPDAQPEEKPQPEPAANEKAVSVQTEAPDYKAIDVDLTQLSSTMVYSEVYNMLVEPDSYVGEVVKMNGQFALYQSYDENGNLANDNIYFACVVADATACCAQGIEFVPFGEFEYPKDFPEVGSEITVTGVFNEYYEGENMYIHLEDAQLIAG